VENVVQANLLACERDRVAGQIFNIATSSPVGLMHLVEAIGTLIGAEITPDFQASRPGDIPHSYASIAEAHHRLGYHPSVPFVDGLRATVEHLTRLLQANSEAPAPRSYSLASS
jgi:UDP-glucose 4-epimerase